MYFLKTYADVIKNDLEDRISKTNFENMISDNRSCEVCGRHVWRYAETGLCFTCTTGESNSDDDYEVGLPYEW
jgi:hypothetical protein